MLSGCLGCYPWKTATPLIAVRPIPKTVWESSVMFLRSRSAHQPGRTRLASRSFPKHKAKSLAKESSRPTSLRHINARELYLLLRANSPCSRADLVRLSGLSGPTVSRTIEYLEKRGLVISLGFGESDGGRPPDQLSLNQGYVYVAGLEISDSGIRIALADLQGNRIAQWSSRLPSKKTPEKVVANTCRRR